MNKMNTFVVCILFLSFSFLPHYFDYDKALAADVIQHQPDRSLLGASDSSGSSIPAARDQRISTCDDFNREDSSTVLGWTEQGGDWSIEGNRLYSGSSSWTYITFDGSYQSDGCIQARAIYGTGSSIRAEGLTGRWISWNQNIVAKIQDNSGVGHWDSFFIYQDNSSINSALDLDFGTDAIIELEYSGTNCTFRIDTDQDGSWDYEYPSTISTGYGLTGAMAIDTSYMDNWCYGTDCSFPEPPEVHECDNFNREDSSTVLGWTEQGGDWSIEGNRLYSGSSSWTYITFDGSYQSDGCIQARAIYGTGSSIRAEGLTGRWISWNQNIVAKIQDNSGVGHWDSFFIYQDNSSINSALDLDFGTDAIIELEYSGTNCTFRIDTDQDGSWDYEYPSTISTGYGLTGAMAIDTSYMDNWCYGTDCSFPEPPQVHECDNFNRADSTTVTGWTERVGDWSIDSNRLFTGDASWSWITYNGSIQMNGCVGARAIHRIGSSVRAEGLTGRWVNSTQNILAQIQDHSSSGYWDSYYILQNGTVLDYATDLNFGTNADIELEYSGTSCTFKIDTDQDGTWDFEYPVTVTTGIGLTGAIAFGTSCMDDWCYGTDCIFQTSTPTPPPQIPSSSPAGIGIMLLAISVLLGAVSLHRGK